MDPKTSTLMLLLPHNVVMTIDVATPQRSDTDERLQSLGDDFGHAPPTLLGIVQCPIEILQVGVPGFGLGDDPRKSAIAAAVMLANGLSHAARSAVQHEP